MTIHKVWPYASSFSVSHRPGKRCLFLCYALEREDNEPSYGLRQQFIERTISTACENLYSMFFTFKLIGTTFLLIWITSFNMPLAFSIRTARHAIRSVLWGRNIFELWCSKTPNEVSEQARFSSAADHAEYGRTCCVFSAPMAEYLQSISLHQSLFVRCSQYVSPDF